MDSEKLRIGGGCLELDGENVVAFDIDNTLVKWDKLHHEGNGTQDYLKIKDPYSGEYIYIKPHKVHIRLMKQYYGRGQTIVAWSAAGVQWTKAVIKALELEQYVSLVMTKPIRHVDDKTDKSEIIGQHIYLEDREK